MNDNYLWDRSGPPDPDVERLEKMLEPLGHKGPAPDFNKVREFPRRPVMRWLSVAAAAAVVMVAVGLWYARRAPTATLEVARLEGTPQIGSKRIAYGGQLRVGQYLVTDASSRARIDVGMIGEVEVEPNSRVGLVTTRADEHRLALDLGTLHARIWAPPGLFFVDTPSATAVDLGCAYTLSVDANGAGLLRVTRGWVAYEWQGRESFVPEGAMCKTRSKIGPSTPYFEDASATFQKALAVLDFDVPPLLTKQQRADLLGNLLAESRPRDALTLWHLLSRLPEEERARVYDRLAALVPPPAGVTREGILAGNRQMLDQWWEALGLRSASWWRMWKQPPPRIR